LITLWEPESEEIVEQESGQIQGGDMNEGDNWSISEEEW
jgi:hypothetical protein